MTTCCISNYAYPDNEIAKKIKIYKTKTEI